MKRKKEMSVEKYKELMTEIESDLSTFIISSDDISMSKPKFKIGQAVYVVLDNAHNCIDTHQVAKLYVSGMFLMIPKKQEERSTYCIILDQETKMVWNYNLCSYIAKEPIPEMIDNKTRGTGLQYGLSQKEDVLSATREEAELLLVESQIKQIKKVRKYANDQEVILQKKLKGMKKKDK